MEGNIKKKLDKDGYVVIENFLTLEECDLLKSFGIGFTKSLMTVETRVIFSTKTQNAPVEKAYFMESNDKIRAFYESEAIGPNGELKVDPEISFNKVGHALHYLHPYFRRITYSEKVKEICRQLQFIDPAVVQSMYIYKNPEIGGEVVSHRDATYLYTEPIPPIGFWIALDDATVENGCLEMVPGSHKDDVDVRLIVNGTEKRMVYNEEKKKQDRKDFVPVPVKRGSLILIHGNVLHQSASNKSTKSRHAYTFHVVEKFQNEYSKDNWLKEGPGAPFISLYSCE